MENKIVEVLFYCTVIFLNIVLGVFIVWDAGRQRPDKKGKEK